MEEKCHHEKLKQQKLSKLPLRHQHERFVFLRFTFFLAQATGIRLLSNVSKITPQSSARTVLFVWDFSFLRKDLVVLGKMPYPIAHH